MENGLNVYDYSARQMNPALGRFTGVDPMAEKYHSSSPYIYTGGSPIRFIDPDGRDWKDANDNKITDHRNIVVYIFYDPDSFSIQSKQMYKDAINKYGENSVAMSNVVTEKEFEKDWGDMASKNIIEVNLNYHGNNQTVMLNSSSGDYITSTGDGMSNRFKTSAKNVQDLPTPSGNINNAQLNLNTCKSNSKTQYELKGTKKTLMEAFYDSFNFKVVRGTSYGVSYDRKTKQPFPGHSWWRGNWNYMIKHIPDEYRPYPGVGLPPK